MPCLSHGGIETSTKLKRRLLILAVLFGVLVISINLAIVTSFSFFKLRQSLARQQTAARALQQQEKQLEAQLSQWHSDAQKSVTEQNRKIRAALQERLRDTENQALPADAQQLVARIRDLLAQPADGAEQNEKLRAALGQAIAAAELREARAANAAIEQEVASVRGIPFKTPVIYETMKEEDFPKFVRQQIREEMTEEEFHNYGRALAFLGLLPDGTDLESVLLSVLSEQVGAFYDEKNSHLVVFSDRPSSSGLDTMIVAHELTHALDDQYFPLKQLGIDLKEDDDRARAALSLIEGNATLVMSQVYLQHAGRAGLASALKDFGVMFRQNAERFNQAPPFVQQSLVFPYLQGQQFVLALMARGGMDAVNDAYRRPPVSTTQILHPEKYFDRHLPQEIKLPNFSDQPHWKCLASNGLGEFGIQVLLALHLDAATAQQAAAGWDGDRYAVYEVAPDQLAMIWVSSWETDADAREFSEAITAWAQKSGRNLQIERRAGVPHRVIVCSPSLGLSMKRLFPVDP